LKTRLNKVLGLEGVSEGGYEKPSAPAVQRESVATKPKPTVESAKPWGDDDDSDDVSYFEKLAED
jgi:hypothetical protein